MVFTAALLSLAGIPLTAGFVGKFYVLLVGVESALWPLIFLLVFGSAVGLFLLPAPRSGHVRLPSRGPGRPCHEARASPSFATILTLTVLTIGVVWLGLYPAPLIHTIRLTVASLL
jgi:NADH-quinone oxidoreductase subunit N